MAKKRYPRTDKDFLIESVATLKEVAQVHTEAGFENIPDSIIQRRFCQLGTFLRDNGMSIREPATSGIDHTFIELNNSDINDKGFYFLQYALPKWEDRLYKDKGEKKEWEFIEKWYETFLKNNPDFG